LISLLFIGGLQPLAELIGVKLQSAAFYFVRNVLAETSDLPIPAESLIGARILAAPPIIFARTISTEAFRSKMEPDAQATFPA